MGPYANLYEDSQGWKQTDQSSENLEMSVSLMRLGLRILATVIFTKTDFLVSMYFTSTDGVTTSAMALVALVGR